ncbi:cell division protein DedD [Pantoea agglomerans]|uniref:cell division protein DedD n=1 Tax=Enterobacter agglomerans TaxID=549 RepID=UPI00301B8535
MASKFQNRLVGTVILVAVGVIVLPGLLDGQKKHYKEEFAAIPLVPKPDDQQDSEMVPPVTQSLPAQPPEGAGNAVSSSNGNGNGNGKTNATAEQGRTQPEDESDPVVVSPPPVHQSVPAQTVTKPKVVEQQKPKVTEQPKQKPKVVEQPKPKPVEQPKVVEQPKQEEPPKTAETTAPAGQAYVVQLGALKNASKVNEIVAQLRLSGYRAFTVPSTPVQGQITRIYVGPDASKAKMQSAVGELKSISGLGGVVKPYSAR